MLKDHTIYSQKAHCFVSANTLTLGFGNSVIPSNVTAIGGGAFNGCNNLFKIKVPYGVTRIGDLTFWGCSSLTQVCLPSSLTSVGNLCFWGCKNLNAIYIPDSVIQMGDSVFYGCHRLVIYCQASQQPNSWQKDWNPIGCQVKWGCDI